ncbi:MAG: glutathione peroxidase [Phycisphaerae bacterium]
MILLRRVHFAAWIAASAVAWGGPLDARAAAAPPVPAVNARSKPKKNAKNPEKSPGKVKTPALAFTMKDIDGKEQDLRQYYGHVVLMVNTASQCGLTPQYEGLEALYEKYRDKGLVVLAFPANNFGRQEPGPNEQIKAFCSKRFHITFPLFGKVSVKGPDICALYRYLTDEKAGHRHGGAIPWNFTKFLIDRKGRVADRFDPRTTPDNPKLIEAIEKRLSAAVPKDSPLAKKKKKEKASKPKPRRAPRAS